MSITPEELAEAKQKIDKVLMGFFTSDSVMLATACMLDWKPSPKQNTIGLNVRGKVPSIEYNPKFINTVSLERVELVIVSEIMKVLLRHCTTRLKEPRQLAALSSSITVNQLLNSELKNILAGIDDITPTPQKFGLEPNQYYEEYFRNLLERSNEVNEKIKQIWDSLTDEQKEQLINQSQQQMMGGNGEPQDGNGQPQQGQGQEGQGNGKKQPSEGQGDKENDGEGSGEGKPKDGSEQGQNDYKDHKDQKEAMKDYFDPNGNTNQGWGENDLFDADIKNFIESKKDSAKHWGKHTGNIMGEIIAANVPTFSHKDIIKRFKKSVTTFKTTSTRMKPSRRYGFQFPGNRREYTTKVLFALDESGSMSDSVVSAGFGIIENVFKHVSIDYITFDTEVKQYVKKVKKKKKSYNVYGRGGTDPQCVFDYADQQKEKYDGIIIFSDMYFNNNIKEPKYKVLWLATDKNNPCGVPWGMKTVLDLYESH